MAGQVCAGPVNLTLEGENNIVDRSATHETTGHTLRRVGALLFGLTYFGWVIVGLAAYQWLVGSVAGLERTAWYHIEGQPVAFGCALSLAAIVVLPLVIVMLAGSRRLPMTVALVLATAHVPLLLWSDPTLLDGALGLVAVVVGLDMAVVAVIAAWLRRVRGDASRLAF